MNTRIQPVLVLLLCALLLSSCASVYAGPATPTPANMAPVHVPKPGTTQPVLTLPATPALPTATFLPNAETLQVSIWVPPYLSETMGEALEEPLRGLFVSDEAQANIRLEVGAENTVSQWVYALATPFPSFLQGMSGDELLSRWQGAAAAPPLLMDPNTHAMLTAYWGTAGGDVRVVPREQLVDATWAQRPSLAIVPFDDLEPRWKVLPVDGLSPIHRDFDFASYRLTIPISLVSDPDRVALIQGNFLIPSSNLDPQKMTVVAVTGVTALVRATASAMEQRGLLYPAKDIRGWLLEADITHISNEVPFAADCPPPNPTQESM
ncbi:MAG TPA: hypothetical protein VHO49_01115, partial [Anaerolineales bacterium]|nr:hypothetical protein [Anaerolineales bacterium]